MIKITGAGAILLLLVACSNSSPEAMVYQAHLGYYGALGAVETYANLPECSETQPQPCKDDEVSSKILNADDAAYATLQSAQDMVRSDGKPEDLLRAVAKNALSVVGAYEELLIDLGVMEE